MFYFQANLAPVDSLLFLWNISCGYEFQDLCSIGLILPIWVIVFDLTWETLTHETHSHYIPLDLRISKATGCCGLQCIWYHLPFPPPSNSRSLSSETFPLIFFFFLSAHLSHLPQILSVPWGFLPQFSFNPLLCNISEYFILVTSAIICMWAVPEWYTFYLDLFFFYFSCPDAHLPAEQLHLNVTRVSQTHQPHGPQLPSCPSSTSSFSQVTHLGEGLCVPREQPKQN